MGQFTAITGNVKLAWSAAEGCEPEVLRTVPAQTATEQSRAIDDQQKDGLLGTAAANPIPLHAPHVSKNAFNAVCTCLKSPGNEAHATVRRKHLATPEAAAEVLMAAELLDMPRLRAWAAEALHGEMRRTPQSKPQLTREQRAVFQSALKHHDLATAQTSVAHRLAVARVEAIVASLTVDSFVRTFTQAWAAKAVPGREALLRMCTDWAIAHFNALQNSPALQHFKQLHPEAHAAFTKQIGVAVRQSRGTAIDASEWQPRLGLLQALIYAADHSVEISEHTLCSALLVAARRGFTNLVQQLALHPSIALEDGMLYQALREAVIAGNTELVDWLTPHVPDEELGWEMLNTATEHGCEPIMERLLPLLDEPHVRQEQKVTVACSMLRAGRADLLKHYGFSSILQQKLSAECSEFNPHDLWILPQGNYTYGQAFRLQFQFQSLWALFDAVVKGGHVQLLDHSAGLLPANFTAFPQLLAAALHAGKPSTIAHILAKHGSKFDAESVCRRVEPGTLEGLIAVVQSADPDTSTLDWDEMVALMHKGWVGEMLRAGLEPPRDAPEPEDFFAAAETNDVEGMKALVAAATKGQWLISEEDAVRAVAMSALCGQREMFVELRSLLQGSGYAVGANTLLQYIAGNFRELEPTRTGTVAELVLMLMRELPSDARELMAVNMTFLIRLCREKQLMNQHNQLVALLPESEAHLHALG